MLHCQTTQAQSALVCLIGCVPHPLMAHANFIAKFGQVSLSLQEGMCDNRQ